MCREPVDQAEDGFEKERNVASKKLFELTDLNGDGLITVDEFALMGLNQTKVHAEKKLSRQDEQSIKDVFVKKFFNEIDSSFQPVPYGKYKDYILRSVNHMDPGDFQAQSLIFDGLVVEATLAREMAEEEKARLLAQPSLPTILRPAPLAYLGKHTALKTHSECIWEIAEIAELNAAPAACSRCESGGPFENRFTISQDSSDSML